MDDVWDNGDENGATSSVICLPALSAPANSTTEPKSTAKMDILVEAVEKAIEDTESNEDGDLAKFPKNTSFLAPLAPHQDDDEFDLIFSMFSSARKVVVIHAIFCY